MSGSIGRGVYMNNKRSAYIVMLFKKKKMPGVFNRQGMIHVGRTKPQACGWSSLC